MSGSLAAAGEAPQLGSAPTGDVVAAMTVEEKVSLVLGTGMEFPGMPPQMQPPKGGETSKSVPGAAGTTVAIPRLGIPSIVLADGPAGLRILPEREGEPDQTYYCTAFPIATLLASSWDLDLVERVGRAVGSELKEYGADVLLAPALNIHRNPLGGRNFEYYSEDPLVTGRMAGAMVKGVQAQGVGTSLKHFVANNHEWNRTTIDVVVGQRALREIYLRGFEIAVREARPWTIMSSYNKLNGTYASESAQLLTGVVRNDWQFDGVVMTDWFGGRDPLAQMRAGNEMLMPGTAGQQQALTAAIQSGDLDEDVLDRNVARILDLILRTPEFLGHVPSNAPDLKAHALTARSAAAQGMVLLHNSGVLPLAAPLELAVFGNSSYEMITGGTGSGDVNEAYSISLLQGLEEAGVSADAQLAQIYSRYLEEQEANRPPPPLPFMLPAPIPEMPVPTGDIARLAEGTELALVTIGRNSGEFTDRQHEGDFALTETEQALIDEVCTAFHAQGKKVLVVLNIAGVIETVSWREKPDAILLAWQPGQEAGYAVADVLTGKTPPSGKLATTFPVRWEDVSSSAGFPGETLLGPDPDMPPSPMYGDRAAEVRYEDDIWVGYRHFATRAVEPAYPFGFGLSYTEFTYADLELSHQEFAGALDVAVTVTNTGGSVGREVVQLYVSAPGKTLPKPALELRGFAKTRSLKPGESERVSFALTARDLASFDAVVSQWVTEAGEHVVKIGASSKDIRQTASFVNPREQVVSSVSTSVDSAKKPEE